MGGISLEPKVPGTLENLGGGDKSLGVKCHSPPLGLEGRTARERARVGSFVVVNDISSISTKIKHQRAGTRTSAG